MEQEFDIGDINEINDLHDMQIDKLDDTIIQQAARIKELEEALEFYADEGNYRSTVLYKACEMAHDSGKRARKALGKADA